MEFFWKLFEAIVIACLLLHMFRHLGDLLTIKILKGRTKNLYCQNRDILGSCENYLKLLHALYNCAFNISKFSVQCSKQKGIVFPGFSCRFLWVSIVLLCFTMFFNFRCFLCNVWLVHSLSVFSTPGRTSSLLVPLAAADPLHRVGRVLCGRSQTAGRGRRFGWGDGLKLAWKEFPTLENSTDNLKQHFWIRNSSSNQMVDFSMSM